MPICPVRLARDPRAGDALQAYTRFKRYGLLDPGDLEAFDVIEAALAWPLPEPA